MGLDPPAPAKDPLACECGAILRGAKTPLECRVFGTACTPDHPIGACMVSSEGACAAYYNYGRHQGGAAENSVGAAAGDGAAPNVP